MNVHIFVEANSRNALTIQWCNGLSWLSCLCLWIMSHEPLIQVDLWIAKVWAWDDNLLEQCVWQPIVQGCIDSMLICAFDTVSTNAVSEASDGGWLCRKLDDTVFISKVLKQFSATDLYQTHQCKIAHIIRLTISNCCISLVFMFFFVLKFVYLGWSR